MAYQKLGSFDDAYIKQSSPSSYQQIQAAKSAWEAANAAGDRADMDAANAAAEAYRLAAQAQADILMSLAQGYPDFLESQQEWEYKLAQQQAAQNQQAWENSQQEWKNQQQIREQQLAAQKEAADQQQDAFNRQLAVAKILAQYGDFSGYISLGFNEDQIAQMRRAWQMQQLQK